MCKPNCKLPLTSTCCHFDQREKSAQYQQRIVLRNMTKSGFLPLIEMTVVMMVSLVSFTADITRLGLVAL
jgi:hypothetical protein